MNKLLKDFIDSVSTNSNLTCNEFYRRFLFNFELVLILTVLLPVNILQSRLRIMKIKTKLMGINNIGQLCCSHDDKIYLYNFNEVEIIKDEFLRN